MGVGAYALRSGSSFYIQLHGLGKTMPWTSAATVIGGLSLIGVPGTAGFLSKWLLVQAALEQGYWPLAMLIVASSLLAVIYVWRLVEVLYLSSPISKKINKEAPISMLLPLWVMALACIYFGFDTDITFTAAKVSAEALLSGSSGMMD